MLQAQQLGRYQLLDRIAFGGMAEIYRAKTFDSEGRAQMVAVKKVLGHLIADGEFLRMLVDEAKITALLKHENIARIYEFARASDDDYFMAMEYVDGKDVRALLERARAAAEPLAPEHVAWIAMQVARGLHAAHTQCDHRGAPLHLVHRDVSPSNVLCSYRGEIKLCDFGIAKATLSRTQTRTGVIKGKVKYMSPEQALGRKLDHRSDIFSLGTVLYEMLTLQAPFQAPNEVELIFAVRDARKTDARRLNPNLPEELNDILNRMMSRSRSGRPQTGEELAEDLRAFLDRYRPGYRRSHFARYMRKQFEDEIEKELRLLEEYVIAGANPEEVGENLIADELGPDAPYTKFTAAVSGAFDKGVTGTPATPETAPAPPAAAAPLPLHSDPTRIFTRNLDLNRVRAESEAAAAPAAAAPAPAAPAPPARSPGIHELQTMLFDRPAMDALRAEVAATPTPTPTTPPPAAATAASDGTQAFQIDDAQPEALATPHLPIANLVTGMVDVPPPAPPKAAEGTQIFDVPDGGSAPTTGEVAAIAATPTDANPVASDDDDATALPREGSRMHTASIHSLHTQILSRPAGDSFDEPSDEGTPIGSTGVDSGINTNPLHTRRPTRRLPAADQVAAFNSPDTERADLRQAVSPPLGQDSDDDRGTNAGQPSRLPAPPVARPPLRRDEAEATVPIDSHAPRKLP